MYTNKDLYAKNVYKKEQIDLVKLMKEIGYRPTFYALPETEVTTKITISMSGKDVTNLLNLDSTDKPSASPATTLPKSSTTKLLAVAANTLTKPLERITLQKAPLQSYVAPINAVNANKYNVDITAATTLRFKIVPVPTPVYIENLIDNNMVDELLEKIETEE
jgi:hypothetical protein